MKHPTLLLAFLLPLVWTAGCTGGRQQVRKDEGAMREVVLEPLVIGSAPDAELGLTEFDAATLLREGARYQEAGQCDTALKFYRRLMSDFPASRYLSAATFNAGRCLEDGGHPLEALEKYRTITVKLPESKDWVDAAFREGTCLASLERHREAADILGRLLLRKELSLSDRLDAMVLRGEALQGMGELLEAEHHFRGVLRQFREHERLEYLDPAPAARAEFRLAEQSNERFRAAPLRLPESQMESDLEAKAALLLEAQAGYLRAMRFADPEWATAAGYRIGTLYLDLHQALDKAPVPEDLSQEEVAVYRDLLRTRLAVLLRKALRVFEMTLSLGERTRSDNQWTRAAREEMARVEAQVMSQLESPAPDKAPAPGSDPAAPGEETSPPPPAPDGGPTNPP